MLQSVPKWLCELLGVPCFNSNTALIVKEYVAILGRFIPFFGGAIQKSRKDISYIVSAFQASKFKLELKKNSHSSQLSAYIVSKYLCGLGALAFE